MPPRRLRAVPPRRQMIGSAPGATYQPQPSTVASPSFPTGGVIIVILAVLIIVQLIGGDLTGRILSWYDHFKPVPNPTLNTAGQVANLQPATSAQVGGPLGAGAFLPRNPGGVAPPAPTQAGPLGQGLLLPGGQQ